jgi:hypothetical protein
MHVVFVKNDFVWIFSFVNDTELKTEASGYFKNFFLSKNQLNSTIGAHYSPKSKSFYFFLGNFLNNRHEIIFCDVFHLFFPNFIEKNYFVYDIQNRIVRKRSLKRMSFKLKNVIQKHDNYDSVYILDVNNFVYSLNLETNYLELVDRKTASMKLFSNCFYE